jgi:PASTA domain
VRFLAEGLDMPARLTALLPRFVLLPVAGVLATATIGFAAQTQLTAAPAPAAEPAPAEAPDALVVPDVRNQAFVFAKGTLEDSGFAWKVAGRVDGYAANQVVSQTPAPGTRVVDNGAPTIALRLKRNARYAQHGAPENVSPYPHTAVELVDAVAAPVAVKKAAPAKKAAPKPAKKPAKKPGAKPKKAAKPAAGRPPAFTVPGARKEPLDEIPLTLRAQRLGRWLESHRRPTDANVRHFLYQHSWIVTGAKFGWWRGDKALRTLLRVDARARALWGIGAENARVARNALEYVEARTR